MDIQFTSNGIEGFGSTYMCVYVYHNYILYMLIRTGAVYFGSDCILMKLIRLKAFPIVCIRK